MDQPILDGVIGLHLDVAGKAEVPSIICNAETSA